MSAVRNAASVQTVYDVAYYLLMYMRYLLTFSQALPFTLPSRFSFRKTKEAIELVRWGTRGKNFSYHEAVKVHQ